MNARVISTAGAIFLVAAGAFTTGMWSTYKNWWPWQKATELQESWRAYRAVGKFLPGDTYTRRKPDVPDVPHSVHSAGEVAKGIWVLNRFDPETVMYVVDIIDTDGNILSERMIDYSLIVDGAHPREFTHITTLLPDGSLLIVWDDAPGMARLDACGKPIWKKTDQIYHHSIEKGVNGYWTWQSAIWNGGEDQRMIRFDPMTGEILESIDLIDDVIAKSQDNHLKLVLPEEYQFDRTTHYGDRADIFHPNDVEELLPEMAAAFPQFEAGDLLVSLRNIDALAVIGRKDGRVKWIQYGPWYHQHDADFQPDGTITVFSNYTDRFRSAILQVDPKTGMTRDLFAGKGLSFDSFIMGKHQHLPNGNWQITSTIQGRVMEVTPDGRIVQEYNNIIDDRFNAILPYAEFHGPDYLTGNLTCDK
jgi:hypothetical protein